MSLPSYIKLFESGQLAARIETALESLANCTLCPRNCGADRVSGETGDCRTGRRALASSYSPHFGEEAPLVGKGGSGTIFFTHCNLGCCFCQNYDISHMGQGREIDAESLAKIMIDLQARGCHNINFVSPTHVIAQILEALPIAINLGLAVPLVYNSGGYDSVETIRLLDGVFDIYMPDFKFWDNNISLKYCGVDDYRERASRSISEMHRQTGDLKTDEHGVAYRGLLVRHLVMPSELAGTPDICGFLADEISPETYTNIMGQYRPCGRADEHPELSRPLSGPEFSKARKAAKDAGLSRLD